MVYTNLASREKNMHGLFESSALLATDVGNIYDVVVRDESDKEISIDNGVAVAVLDYTGNGLEERYGRVAKITDKIAVTGAPAEVKTYQIADPSVHTDIFGIASYQFTDDSAEKVKVGNLVTVDGKGAWIASEASELATLQGTNGFVGKVHSLSVGTYYTIVRIQVLQNKDIA